MKFVAEKHYRFLVALLELLLNRTKSISIFQRKEAIFAVLRDLSVLFFVPPLFPLFPSFTFAFRAHSYKKNRVHSSPNLSNTHFSTPSNPLTASPYLSNTPSR